jgi:hypothetical protein
MADDKHREFSAFHASSEDGKQLVGIGPLRVMVTNDDGSWFAQGIEIDYFAQGSTLDDLRDRFERGLTATIAQHLTRFGNIERLLTPAPPEVWKEFYQDAACHRVVVHHVSVHDVGPFDSIAYCQKEAA